MAVACFIRSIDDVENLGNDIFRVTVSCKLMDTSNSQFTCTFDSTKGADWRIQCREGVQFWVTEHLGEVIDLFVLPSMETV